MPSYQNGDVHNCERPPLVDGAIAIFADSPDGTLRWFWQIPSKTQGSNRFPIRYCPVCGDRLRDTYDDD